MDGKGFIFGADGLILLSPENTPFGFKILVREDHGNENDITIFQVTGIDYANNSDKTCFYQLDNREHKAYLDLFANLASDFGLRMPGNRQPKPPYSFKKNYTAVLTENIVPEILYGYGDPAVIRVENEPGDIDTWYYLVSTSNDAPNSFPICRSKNLVDWEFVNFVFPEGCKPAWAADGEFVSDYWAPEIHKIGNEFRVYFVARDKETFELCIGMARSARPGGAYVADEYPILKGNKIDPHVFCDNNDIAYLYWKEDNNGVWPSRLISLLFENPHLINNILEQENDRITASFIITLSPWIETLKAMEGFLVQQVLIEAITTSFFTFETKLRELADRQPAGKQKDIRFLLEVMKTPVYAQKLSSNGSLLVDKPVKIIENDQMWEAHLVEGMWVTKYLDRYYMFYSGNDFSTDQYGVGVAIADDPLGPFKKLEKQLLRSSEEWWAPGHPSVAIGPGGKHLLFLHAFFPEKAGYKEFRALLTVPVKLHTDDVELE